MKKSWLFYGFSALISGFCAMLAVSCNGCGSVEKEVEEVRRREERALTIINKTKNAIKAYRVTTKSGALIEEQATRMDEAIKGNVVVKVSPSFDNDPRLQVQLIDVFNKIYVSDFDVPLTGNTDVVLTGEHRKSEGWLKDRGRDMTEWFNKNK